MDLGDGQTVQALSAWSFNQNGSCGRQLFTVYGSNSGTDPGWNVRDSSKFIPLGSIDTASLGGAAFTASSLLAEIGGSLGSFRWILWQTAPVTGIQENTAWQALVIETAP